MLFAATAASAFPANSLYGKYRNNSCDAVLLENDQTDPLVATCTKLKKRITRLRTKMQTASRLSEDLGKALYIAQQGGNQAEIDAASEALNEVRQDIRGWSWKLTRTGTAPE